MKPEKETPSALVNRFLVNYLQETLKDDTTINKVNDINNQILDRIASIISELDKDADLSIFGALAHIASAIGNDKIKIRSHTASTLLAAAAGGALGDSNKLESMENQEISNFTKNLTSKEQQKLDKLARIESFSPSETDNPEEV